jgi:cytochrome b561
MRGNYSNVAIVLHWMLAVVLVGCFFLGLYMTGLPLSPERIRLYSWHKWIGVTILAFTLLRLLWRLTHRPPEELPMPPWQRRASRAAHRLLYLLCVAIPLVGWAYSSSAGFPVVLFGVLPLPDFVPADKALSAAIKPWHQGLAWTLAALVLAHVAAALKHHFIDRDGLLSRMWFSSRKSDQHESPSSSHGHGHAHGRGAAGLRAAETRSGTE